MALKTEQLSIIDNKSKLNGLLLLIILLFLIVPYVKNILIPFGISIFLFIFMDPIITRLEGNGLKRKFLIFMLLTMLTGLAIVLIIGLGPTLHREITNLDNLNDATRIMSTIQKLPLINENQVINTLAIKYHSFFTYLIDKGVQNLPSDFSIFLLLIIIPLITFLLLKDGHYIKYNFMYKLPNRYFEFAIDLLFRLKKQLGNWAQKQLFIALIIGGLTTMALYLLQLPNFVSIGILVGFAHLIPFYGPVIGAVIAITIIMLTAGSLKIIIGVIIALATVKLFYNLLLTPLVKSHTIALHPIVIILVMLIGSYIWGLMGMLLFVPLSTIFFIITRETIICMKQYHLF